MDKRPLHEAPREEPVYLVFRQGSREWRSPALFVRTAKGWRAYTSGLPCASAAAIIGWMPADQSPPG